MAVRVGVDLIYLPQFKKSLENSGEKFMQRVFLRDELADINLERLAGIFAAKEAVMKALSLPTNSWHDIKVTHNLDGAPKVAILNQDIASHSLSISHDNDYVIAQFVAILE